MFVCAKGHVMTLEIRPTWTGFKTLVCHTCNREAMIAKFGK